MDSEVRRKLIQEIATFDGSTASLGHLIANLDVIWAQESWNERRAFRREWGLLEDVHAGAVEQKLAQLNRTDHDRVRAVLSRLPQLMP